MNCNEFSMEPPKNGLEDDVPIYHGYFWGSISSHLWTVNHSIPLHLTRTH